MKSKYLESEEVQILKKMLTPAEWLPLWLALETGLRIGDVLALRCSDVRRDGIHYKAQKTGKRGVAKISAPLRKQLRKSGEWLFPSPKKFGSPLTRQACWQRIKRAMQRARLDSSGVSPHAFRKVFAVELYREKGFKATQEALQHSNTATTEIYAFADWSTGANADLPLTRKDLQLIVKMCLEALGDHKKK